MPGDKAATAAIIGFIESLGYAVSVHHMREYVEMHAVSSKNPDSMVHIARCDRDNANGQVYHGVHPGGDDQDGP